MGALLSIATCGMYPGSNDSSSSEEKSASNITSMQNGPTVGDVLSGARATISGARAKAQKEQEDFERQTRVQQAIDKREQKCAELRASMDDLNRKALRVFAIIKDKNASPASKQKAQNEARIVLRTRQRYDSDLKKYTKQITVSRRALTVSTTVKNNDDDKTLMLDIAELTRAIKLDDADITAISTAGVEVIENTDNIEQHQEEIDNAWMTLNDAGDDKGLEYDLNHDDSLLQALAALEAEVKGEQQASPSSTTTATAKKPKVQRNNVDDDNESLFENVDLSNLPTAPSSASLVYSGENNPIKSPPRKVAVAETVDGQFRQSSVSNRLPNKKNNLDFF